MATRQQDTAGLTEAQREAAERLLFSVEELVPHSIAAGAVAHVDASDERYVVGLYADGVPFRVES